MINKIGITERGDGGLDFSWADKIKDLKACIVISKNINDKLIKHLLENKSKIILHATITGYGGSILEPNVPYAEWNFSQLNKLIALLDKLTVANDSVTFNTIVKAITFDVQ